MTRFESSIINWIIKRKNIILLVIICIAGFIARWSGLDFESGDMRGYLLPWFEEIKENGFSSLSKQVGDYNLLYQTIIVLLTKVDINPVVLYKAVSIAGDYYLAFNAARLVCVLKNRPKFQTTFNIVFTAVLILPTVIINSAFWGQCDSLYCAFLLATLFYAYKEKWIIMAVMFGIAFAFKLQSIFLLPFLIIIYIYYKKFSLFYFFISAVVFWASGILCFFQGRNLLDPFKIYFGQTYSYPQMYANIPNYWLLLGMDYSFSVVALTISLVLLGILLYLCISGKVNLESSEGWLGAACWCFWTCVMFLPAMHERYAYLIDILLIMLAFYSSKYLKFAIVTSSLSLFTYSIYFARSLAPELTQWHAAVYIAAYVWFTLILFKKIIVKSDNESGTDSSKIFSSTGEKS